jgi:trans-AT polyketide synthase/acyltransferase/oxidoreductase domain-containing protein
MAPAGLPAIGSWRGAAAAMEPETIGSAVERIRETAHVVQEAPAGRIGLAFGGEVVADGHGAAAHRLLAVLPPLFPEWLGDRSFLEVHGARFPYVVGEMANGIATPALVVAAARMGALGFFGAAGLGPDRVQRGLAEIQSALAGSGLPWGANLIHSPNEPELEEAVADLYLRHGVRRVCASAYMGLTPAVVRYAASGLAADAGGRIRRPNHLFAKVSRPEVAIRFLSPAPGDILQGLVERGQLTRQEADLAGHVALAEDVTVEADSGGHTDNRPLGALFPAIRAIRDEAMSRNGYARPVRVGAAGGLGTPAAVAGAFALGAAYVLTGSINQAAVESGLSADGKAMLAQADIADVTMAPAADMFEQGIRVQVLKRGTMFAARAARLYQLYETYDGLESLPRAERARLESEVFRAPLEEVWTQTRRFFEERDAPQVARAERDPRHRMALVFRWYLGLSSKWAITGEVSRRLDYQIWCGPAMGAFNAWSHGTFLAEPANRTVEQIARNLLEGAAVVTRAQHLRSAGLPVPSSAFEFRPRRLG